MDRQPLASQCSLIWHRSPHAARHGHHKILIRSMDTDVMVWAVSVVQGMHQEDELWLAFGTGKSFHYLAAHEMAACLGPEKERALPMFHALTGCDTVSSFSGHGKKTAWAIWAIYPDLTEALLKPSAASKVIPEDFMHIIERFVIPLYDRTSSCMDINKARRKLFAQKEQRAAAPTNKGSLRGACQKGTLPGGSCLGTTPGTITTAAPTNQLGLDEACRRLVHAILDETTLGCPHLL
ncbi:hypothetical protein Hamer_G019662 [Homarus americanus]|uniref:Uncharacterized protein n=1 Tax=Homarus americanus TaxID=6706 RepID=A0A8J5JVD3_HOMAM|nr:hypothetical protein Hamer_G019662 [Homarus americanus]